MQVFLQKDVLRAQLTTIRSKSQTIGVVPTMGALHRGHLSLVKRAVSENDQIVVTIFVNPTQFNNSQDLEKYPRTLDADIALLQSISENILVFAPSTAEIYDTGPATALKYDFDGLETAMEGEFRKGHFDGVATIVEALLRIVEPDNAYFGEKDFQQLQIVKKMAALKKLPTNIIGCPIEREAHGLAMSSRNERLSPNARQRSKLIQETLLGAKNKFGTENVLVIKEWVEKIFAKSTLFTLEYFEIAEEETLIPISKKQNNKNYRAFIAAYVEEVRLIDNLAL